MSMLQEGGVVLLGTRQVAVRLSAVMRLLADRSAVSDLTRTVEYGALAGRVAATALRMIDADPGRPAIVSSEEPVAFVTAVLATAVAGRTCVIAPGGSSEAAVASLAAATGAGVLLGPSARPIASHACRVVPIASDDAADPTISEVIAARDRTDVPWPTVVSLDNTSGSTGAPRLIAQRSPLNFGRPLPPLTELPVNQNLAVLATSSSAFRRRIARAILSGSRLTAFRIGGSPPHVLLERLAEARPTLLAITPTLLRHLHHAASGSVALTSVVEVETIGEHLRWADVGMARRLCGPDVVVRNRYGSTEAGLVTQHVIRPHEPLQEGAVPAGRPIPGRRVWIAGEDGPPLGPDESGAIVIEGSFLSEGIDVEPLVDGHVRYRSNDRGRIDGTGDLWIEGRADRMVKIAGSRVELEPVEATLRTLPGIRDVVVVPVELTDDAVRLVAHVLVDDDAPGPADLRRLAGEQLASMAVPSRFVIRRDAFPLLASGKVDLRALTAEGGAPAGS
jgi:acyl-coenzyme A synthetase/AMP-(fatty) acid ligase